MRKVVFISSPALWEHGHGPQHPLKPGRLKRTHELLHELGMLSASNLKVLAPHPASEDQLALFHSPAYIRAVQRLSRGNSQAEPYRYGFGPGDNPVFEAMFETESLKAGGALMGAELLVQGASQVAFNVGGGMHHASPDRASGFCVFNDAAVAIRWLLQQGMRVAYVDIDVHHGDGVQNAFYDTDRVLTISLHQSGRTLFPGSGYIEERGIGKGEGYSVNLPLPPYTDDEVYLWAFRELVPPIVRRYRPDILVTQLGVDTHFLDPLANLSLTTLGQKAVFTELHHLSPGRWLALGGGGYNLDVVPRAWAIAFSIMSEQPLPDELPASYRAKYGGQWLEDRETPSIRDSLRPLIRRQVEEAVGEIKAWQNLA